MKLTIKAGDLEKVVKRVIQYASRGRDIAPGYRLVLMEVTDKGALRLSAHNAAAGARASFSLSGAWEAGVVAVSAEHLSKIISILPKGKSNDVDIKCGRGPKISLRCQNARMSLPRADIADFPDMPRPAAQSWFDVTDKAVNGVINHLLWAMCRDESRPALAGVHLSNAWSEACDGHLTARKAPGIVPVGTDVIVPGDTWHSLRLFVGEGRTLRVAVEDDKRVWFRGEDWAVFSTLIASNYPNTSPFVFDVDDEGFHNLGGTKVRVHWIHLNRKEALAVVARIVGASVSQEEKSFGASVKFEVNEGSLHFVSHYPIDDMSNSIIVNEKVDWAEGSVVADDDSGFMALDGIGLYSTYMKMALESLPSDVIKMMWAEPIEQGYLPVQFHDDSGVQALVMPRRL